MGRARSLLLPAALLGAVLSVALSWRAIAPALLAADEPVEEASARKGPLSWLHNDVIMAARTSYPVALMIGFTAYGNLQLRKECGGEPYPNWFFGWPLGMICYTYSGAFFSDLIFVSGAPLRAMSNDNIFLWYSIWFLVVQNSEWAYKFLQRKNVNVVLTTWFLADATRASLLFLERAVATAPVFTRGVWQAFIWCGAGPLARVAEKCLRGKPVPALDAVVPSSFNVLKLPVVMMFWNMIFYLVYLGYFTDCDIFGGKETSLNMVECGSKYSGVYATCTYIPCLMHVARGYGAFDFLHAKKDGK